MLTRACSGVFMQAVKTSTVRENGSLWLTAQHISLCAVSPQIALTRRGCMRAETGVREDDNQERLGASALLHPALTVFFFVVIIGSHAGERRSARERKRQKEQEKNATRKQSRR